MELEFKKFDSTVSLAEQRELFKDCFPETAGKSAESTDHYFWKFNSFPNSPPSYEYGSWNKASAKLVGYYAALPYHYKIENDVMTSGMVCDVMTHSSTRGQGIFTKLGKFSTAELEKSGIDFAIGYPIRKEVIPGHLKVGWKVAFELPLYLKVLKSRSILKKFHLNALAPVVDLGLTAFRGLTGGSTCRKKTDVRVMTSDVFFTEYQKHYENFFNEWCADKPNHLIKSAEFWKWRLSAPHTDYKVFALFDADKISAFCVTRATELQEVPSLAILDLMVLNRARNSLTSLYQALEKNALEQKLETIAVMCAKKWAAYYRLMRFGFLKTPLIFKLIIKPLSQRANAAPLFEEERWHLMWVDCDDL